MRFVPQSHQSALKAVPILATWRKGISWKADIARRVRSGIGSRTRKPDSACSLEKCCFSLVGKMMLLHSSRQVQNTEGNKGGGVGQVGVHGAFWGETLFVIRQFLIEITVNWNTFFGTWLKTKGWWQMRVGCLNCMPLSFKELRIVLKFKCPLTNRETVSRSDKARG